jgi:ABC-2 type transport system ATP-binding protein
VDVPGIIRARRAMIEAAHLTKVFGAVTAIEDVGFHVATGEVVGFLGPNGAGKTTTMRILAGVFPPTAGDARIAGHSVIDAPMAARRAVGYFPEYAPFYPDLSVEAYLHFVGRLKRLRRRERRAAVGAVLERCGLVPVAGRLVGKLSKGYRQRVGLAQALLGDPPVLILDEPTIGLDPEQVTEIRTLIRSLRGTRAVLLSSHILSEIEAICSRVIVLNRGRVLAEGTPEVLMAALGARHRLVLRVDGPRSAVLEALAAVHGVRQVAPGPDPLGVVAELENGEAGGRAVARTLAARGWPVLEMRYEPLPLEEIFLRLVRRAAEPPS